MSKKIALADDHVLLRNGLANLIKEFGYEVVCEANNGKELIEKIIAGHVPDIVLMDINMPVMDGYETTIWLRENMADVKVLALSMYDDENSIIRMIRNGARGYILKDIEPPELKTALNSLVSKGFYYSELVTGKLIYTVNNLDRPNNTPVQSLHGLNDKEVEFLRLAATEMTYKEIADKMCLSPRTIDGYRDALFEKLNIKSRVGLVLFAVKNSLVRL
jgi:two-component system, NarL family, invasion response regulator UvrY